MHLMGRPHASFTFGEFLRRADELIGRGAHPNAIIKGFRIGLKQALEAAVDNAIEKKPI